MTTSPTPRINVITGPIPRIDSNIILRYLTDEPPAQAEPVARLFNRIAAGEITVWVDDIVIAEVVWTLSSYYKMSRKETTEALLRLLSEEGIICERGSAVQAALVIFEEKNIDFVD